MIRNAFEVIESVISEKGVVLGWSIGSKTPLKHCKIFSLYRVLYI
jgi:hypothetical protein